MKRLSALSIRQPHVEQILRGKKKIEYRSRPTSKRGRVYVYASKSPADQKWWDEIGMDAAELMTGVIVGTLEL
ncbi:MAG: hypothetical protein QOE77_3028 [Blastocatellia bacterium]|jgi:hypothetical protein|nr:hypothetical protein [Blastocatellia bacterium]